MELSGVNWLPSEVSKIINKSNGIKRIIWFCIFNDLKGFYTYSHFCTSPDVIANMGVSFRNWQRDSVLLLHNVRPATDNRYPPAPREGSDATASPKFNCCLPCKKVKLMELLFSLVSFVSFVVVSVSLGGNAVVIVFYFNLESYWITPMMIAWYDDRLTYFVLNTYTNRVCHC